MNRLMTQSFFVELQAFTVDLPAALRDCDLLGDPKPVYLVLALVDDFYRGGVPQCRWRIAHIGYEDSLNDLFCARVLTDQEMHLAAGPAIEGIRSAGEMIGRLLQHCDAVTLDEFERRGIQAVGFDVTLCNLAEVVLDDRSVLHESQSGRPAMKVVTVLSMLDINAIANVSLLLQHYLSHRIRRHIHLALPRVLTGTTEASPPMTIYEDALSHGIR